MSTTKHAGSRAADGRRFVSVGLLHLLLAGISFAVALPFLWMVLTSLKSLAEVGLESWMPSRFLWKNYGEVFDVIPFGTFYWNERNSPPASRQASIRCGLGPAGTDRGARFLAQCETRKRHPSRR